ncbi:hypothetical protein [Amycolatopsis sp. lyj-109]|uniref:hypothetical protein n=1 Tax=Amycolatopsis sp. lyj-109 TaxID=2789287 RepID=UPI00397BDB37
MIERDRESKGWTGLGRTADILGILGFFGISMAAIVGWLSGGEDGPVTPSTSSSPSSVDVTASPGPSPSGTPTLTATTPLPTPPPEALRTPLSEFAPVSGSNNIDLKFDDVTMRGAAFGQSLHYSCSLYCNSQSPATYVADLGGKYTKFEATAGIPSTGRDVPTKIEIDMDGRLKGTYVVSVAKPTAISISVAKVQRLRITFYPPEKLRTPLQSGADIAGGDEHVLPDVALGTPTLQP